MDKVLFEKWRRYIPDLGAVLRVMQEKTIIAVGVAPYPRIIPSLFLDRYIIYSVKDTSDLDVLRGRAAIYSLEERYPKIAAKVHATGYLINNFTFQGFLKARREPYRLMFYQTTRKIVDALNEKGWDWIGNDPESFSKVLLKGDFRDLVKSLHLPSLPDWRLPREEFLEKSFEELRGKWNRPVVVQRADFDVAGELGTFFLKTEDDWKTCRDILARDERFKTVTISPFITGNSLSMLGCITHEGILTSTLQLQLIDVPESLHGQLPTGVFLGHDWGYRDWTPATERTAQDIVEEIGRYLASRGFKGIFGIDFLYDPATQELFPIECNPRFTGALPVYSLMAIANGAPPMELFHIMSHLNIHAPFDFDGVNSALKRRLPLAHISLTPKGVFEMKADLPAGVYSFDPRTSDFRYERPGAFYGDLRNPNEFLMIDSVPRPGGRVIQNVARLCKLIFPRRIARSTFEVEPEIGALITRLSTELRKGQTSLVAGDGEGMTENGE